MKNPSTNSFSNATPDELKRYIHAGTQAKKPSYIYTEEDLGEGILDIGVSC